MMAISKTSFFRYSSEDLIIIRSMIVALQSRATATVRILINVHAAHDHAAFLGTGFLGFLVRSIYVGLVMMFMDLNAQSSLTSH